MPNRPPPPGGRLEDWLSGFGFGFAQVVGATAPGQRMQPGDVRPDPAKHLATRLAKLHHHEVLILDLTEVPLVDSSASMALEDAIVQGRTGGDPVYLVGIAGRVRVTLDRIGVLALVPAERPFATRVEALRAAAVELGMGTAESE